MAYTITTGLKQDMTDAVNRTLGDLNNAQDRKVLEKTFKDFIDVLFTEFTSVDSGA